MLEEAAEHAADGDVVAQPGDARPEAADPARDDVDGHAGGRRDVERLDDLLVDERVDLDADPRRARPRARRAETRSISCRIPSRRNHGPTSSFRNTAGPREPGDGVEHVGDIRGDVRVGREQPEVLVGRCVRGVVVPGADVDVAAQAVLLVPDEQRELRVDLQIGNAVDDVDACALECARPLDVAPFVEARLELHEANRLLPLLGGLAPETRASATSRRSGRRSP